MLRAIYASVLSSRASEAEHERSEPSLHVSLYMSVGELIYAVEEGEYLAVVLKESDHRLVENVFSIPFTFSLIQFAKS